MWNTHILSLVVFNQKAKVQNRSLKFFLLHLFSFYYISHKKSVHANIYLENVVRRKAKGKILCLKFQFFLKDVFCSWNSNLGHQRAVKTLKMSSFMLGVRPRFDHAKSGFCFIVQFTSWKYLFLSSLKLTCHANFKKIHKRSEERTTEALFSYSDVKMDQRHMHHTGLLAGCRRATLNIQWQSQKALSCVQKSSIYSVTYHLGFSLNCPEN